VIGYDADCGQGDMRKVRDHYYHRAKRENYPARSVYKLEEAQKKHRFLRQGQKVLDLGCHPGSWCLYAAGIVGDGGLVVGADLTATNLARRKGHAEIIWLCYDVNRDDFIDLLRTKWGVFHVVLSDMAPRTIGNRFVDHQRSLVLARRAFAVCRRVLRSGGTFYCKIFDGEDLMEYKGELKPYFQSVKVVKPPSSRRESREVFLLGSRFRPQGGKTQQG